MKNKIKRKLLTITAMSMMLASAPGIVQATSETVYFNGDPVNWDHGRKWGVTSYSEVQTHIYEHSATANSTFSVWKNPGVTAYASQFVGTSRATAYWNCR